MFDTTHSHHFHIKKQYADIEFIQKNCAGRLISGDVTTKAMEQIAFGKTTFHGFISKAHTHTNTNIRQKIVRISIPFRYQSNEIPL